MNNKIINTLKGTVTVAMTLAAVVWIGSAVPTFAEGTPVYGTEASPAQAAITKNLTMPEGTTTPAATFNFEFTALSVDDSVTTDDLATMPAIEPVSIAFTASDAGTVTDGAKTVLNQSGDVLAGVTFPHAGVYEYRVEESQSVTGYTPESNETYTFSTAQYTIKVYVKNGSEGLYVAAIASTITIKDNSNQTSSVGDKVDPTPEPGDPNVTGKYSKMIFTNTYSKTAGGIDPTDPDNHVLTISKAVAGEYGDLTKYFAYHVTISQPASMTGTVTYKAYVLNSSNEVVTAIANAETLATDGNGLEYIEFTAGTSEVFNLKHDQKLVFTDLHVGANYVAIESATEHYTASASLVVNGASPINLSNAADNTALSTETRLIGENQNSAAFTNTYRTITPTGVMINNLPFIMILILAVGAFVTFIIVKTRKKSNYIANR